MSEELERKKLVIIRHIVAIPKSRVSNGRAVAELTQDRIFKDAAEVTEFINKEGDTLTSGSRVMEFYEFIDECNDGAIDLEQVWISHFYIEGKQFP